MKFKDLFKSKTQDSYPQAESYLQAINKAKHTNLQNICEVSHFNYKQLQYFISKGKWSYTEVFNRISNETSKMFLDESPVSLIIDESGWRKKGKHSVGVRRQYCGNIGKTDNCQVAVFGALAQGEFSTLVDARLYIPQDWINDEARCNKAGIPKEEQVFKTKIDLAREMIHHQIKQNVRFDYIVFDSYYGCNHKLTQEIDELGISFIGDIRSNQHLYLQKPSLVVKEKTSKKGKDPEMLIPDTESITVKDQLVNLRKKDFRKTTLRNTAKGKLKVRSYSKKVWIYDKKNSRFLERTLIIRENLNKNRSSKYNYFLTNIDVNLGNIKEVLKQHAQRYFIEHNLKEVKSVLGLHQTQTRLWLAWYHQIALILLMLSFIFTQKIKKFKLFPILSANDIGDLLSASMENYNIPLKAIEIFFERYFFRQNDVNLVYLRS